MNPTKQALLAELSQALAPLLPPSHLATPELPKPVAHALEQLAESLLRWRTNQARRPRTGGVARSPASESAALAHLLQGRLQEENDTPSE